MGVNVLESALEFAGGVPNTAVMTRNANRAAEHTADRTAPGRGAERIARHREARRRISGGAPVGVRPRPLTGPGRFDHLKRTYD